jgi:plastocyanin
MTPARWLVAVAVLAPAPLALAAAQTMLDRPPNLGGTWVPEPGVLRFDFLHRFWIPEGSSNLVNYPTFTFAIGLPSRLAAGLRYATHSSTAGSPVETDWTRGRVTLAAAARAMSNAFRTDRARGAVAGGVLLRVNDYVALSGDVAGMLDPDPGEDPAWSAGLLLVIPGSPHTFSLHASNVTVNTIQGSSRRGTTFTSKPLYGFEFTIPLHLNRFAPWFGGGRRVAAAASVADAAATVEMREYRFQRDTVYLSAGQAVRWVNRDPVEHTVTFSQGGPPSSGNLRAGDAFVARFERPGTYAYSCIPHPFMKGVVVVR